MMYDQVTKARDYTNEYRILKKKLSEDSIMISFDGLGLDYIISAKYIYDNEEVNLKQDYTFNSINSHLFLTENFQRSPSTNKTLIQLYSESTLIGYDVRINMLKTSINPNATTYEY